MKSKNLFLFAIIFALFGTAATGFAQIADVPDNVSGRLIFPFDAGWRFYKGDAPGAEQSVFDDAAWRLQDVPHDWSIEGPYAPDNPTGRGGGYLPSGVAWYRNSFSLPETDANRRVFIDFDGVMANSDVWVNGFHLGNRPYGYVSFRYDMTGHLNFGASKTNLIAVRADTSQQPASRYYTGAGINRHVRLIVADTIHVDHWGLFVTTPNVSSDKAMIHVQTTIVNDATISAQVAVQTSLLEPDGKPAAQDTTSPVQNIAPGQTATFEQDIPVANPKLWDLQTPNLYKAIAKVVAGGAVLDNESAAFGIRTAEFKSDTGFWLNGKNIKILGLCLHADGGAVGTAVPIDVWRQRLNAVKLMGANAVRWAHNPPDPALLDLCDRLGILCMDEMFDCWTVGKSTFDYHLFFNDWSLTDLRDTVMRDRNHPSVILYSAGNEIHDTPKAELSLKVLTGLVAAFHKYDPSRPVTQALFRPNVSHDYDNGLADLLDVIGTNYRNDELMAAWRANQGRKIIGTEQNRALVDWTGVRDNPPFSGEFIWAGIDYVGEGAGNYPNVVNNEGLMDHTANFNVVGYHHQAWWSTKPVVVIMRDDGGTARGSVRGAYAGTAAPSGPYNDWTPADGGNGQIYNVSVISNCAEVELFLNGASLGVKPANTNDADRSWSVPFAPGALKAIGRNGGKEVAAYELHTAGAPARITLSSSSTKLIKDFDSVGIVTASIADANGVLNPNATNTVSFNVEGPGVLIATDNGAHTNTESFQSPHRAPYKGTMMAIIRATASSGKITLTATSPGFKPAALEFDIDPTLH